MKGSPCTFKREPRGRAVDDQVRNGLSAASDKSRKTKATVMNISTRPEFKRTSQEEGKGRHSPDYVDEATVS